MNPWLWNQQRQQQLFWMGAGNQQREWAPWNGIHIDLNHFGPQSQHFSNILNPGPIQRQWQPQQPPQPESYDVNEIRLARKSLGAFLREIPASRKSWQPLRQDGLPNTWEGESGMMEHIKQPFPAPARGQTAEGSKVWDPDGLVSETPGEATAAGSSASSDNLSIKTIPESVACGSGADVVCLGDDDSDVEIVTNSAGETLTRDADSSATAVEDDSHDSRLHETAEKTAVG